VQVIYEHHASEGRVFEKSEKSEVEDKIKNQDKLSLLSVLIEKKPRKVIDDYRCEHEQNIDRLSPGIEEKAGKEQKYVHISVFMKDPAADEDHRQKDHYKNE
jgi:hypothetical protein